MNSNIWCFFASSFGVYPGSDSMWCQGFIVESWPLAFIVIIFGTSPYMQTNVKGYYSWLAQPDLQVVPFRSPATLFLLLWKMHLRMRDRRYTTLWFTGLSGAGKSTLATLIHDGLN